MALSPAADGRFQLLDKVGHGSYGAVHKALDQTTSTVVAVKIVPMSTDADELSKIVNEVEILRDCQHENITRFLAAYVNHDDLWIAMEYCSGGSALTVMKALKSPYSEEIISVILRETLKGLDYLHDSNRMHRDIKAANILFTEDGKIKLADFGVSAQLSDKFSLRKTCIGSPYWMAPEVLLAQTTGNPYNIKADVWSLGITALELAQMKPPLDHLHPMRAMYEIPNSKPPKLKEEKKWSKKFHDFIAEALSKQPTDRPLAKDLLKHPFIEAHKNVGSAAMVSLLDQAQNAKALNRQRLITKYGVTDQSVTMPFLVGQSLAVSPPAPPKALASKADAVVAAAHTDTLPTATDTESPTTTRASGTTTLTPTNNSDKSLSATKTSQSSSSLASIASSSSSKEDERVGTIKSPSGTPTSSLKPRSDMYYGTLRKHTLDRLMGLTDFLEEDVDESELPSSVSFLEMLEMDATLPTEEGKHSLSGLVRPGGPVPDNGKKLFNIIELAFTPFEVNFADIWGRYILLASERGLYATVAGSTSSPLPLIKGVPFRRIDVVEEYGVLVALGGKSNSVRIYDLALLRKVIEVVFQFEGTLKTPSPELEQQLKQLEATCEKLSNTRSTEEYRLTRLESSIYLTVMGKKHMIVFSWAQFPFNRFMEVTSLSFVVTYPTLIGLVAGMERLKSYLLQVKDELFLVDFHSTEMSLVDLKPAFSDNPVPREPIDVTTLLELSDEKQLPTLTLLTTLGAATHITPGAAALSVAASTHNMPDRRGSATSMASLSSFVDQMKKEQERMGATRVAVVYGDLNADAMLLTVDDKTKAIGPSGETKGDLVIRWSNPPVATVCRANRYIVAFEDTLIEVRSATTGEPIQSLFTTQLKLRMLKQSPSGLAILVLGISNDKKRGCVVYSFAHDA